MLHLACNCDPVKSETSACNSTGYCYCTDKESTDESSKTCSRYGTILIIYLIISTVVEAVNRTRLVRTWVKTYFGFVRILTKFVNLYIFQFSENSDNTY